jgi:TrmH family RNA methyltransferase
MVDTRKDGAFGDLLPASGHSIVVVLVEPGDARNIGAVARAMSNLAVRDLRLVSPRAFDVTVAKGVACWGEDVIDNSKRFESLQEAVRDCHEVVGFASDSSGHRVPQAALEEWVKTLADDGRRTIAVVFGSEDNGLSKADFPLCQYLIRIPSSGANRSYNLAQSVLLALYQIRTRAHQYVGGGDVEWSTSAQVDELTAMVLKVAEGAGFLNENSPAHIADLLRNMTRRGKFNARELKLLTGLLGMIRKRF